VKDNSFSNRDLILEVVGILEKRIHENKADSLNKGKRIKIIAETFSTD